MERTLNSNESFALQKSNFKEISKFIHNDNNENLIFQLNEENASAHSTSPSNV